MKKILLVLGGKIEPINKLSKGLMDRLDVALKLWSTGNYDYIMLSGGITRPKEVQTRSEAYLMSLYLMEQGISKYSLILEQSSLNTFENIIKSSDLLEYFFKKNFEFKIVSHFLHSLRAVITARHLGVKAKATVKIEQWNFKSLFMEVARVIFTFFDPLGKSKITQSRRNKRMY